MMPDCVREQDVLDAIASNRWPARCDDELRAHVADCASCADLITVVRPLLDAHDQTFQDVRVPPPSVVWWRAQLRARTEGARAATRPIAIAQGVAFAVVLVVAAALFLTGYARLDGWMAALGGIGSRMAAFRLPVPEFVSQHATLLLLALGTFLVVAPLIVYFAVTDPGDSDVNVTR